jgi:hypothetical protein
MDTNSHESSEEDLSKEVQGVLEQEGSRRKIFSTEAHEDHEGTRRGCRAWQSVFGRDVAGNELRSADVREFENK